MSGTPHSPLQEHYHDIGRHDCSRQTFSCLAEHCYRFLHLSSYVHPHDARGAVLQRFLRDECNNCSLQPKRAEEA